jgi:hypothetical protein
MSMTRTLVTCQAVVWGLALAGCGAAPDGEGGMSLETSVSEITSGGIYVIKNVKSGKCFDITGGSTKSGALIEQWDCGTTKANQQFKFRDTGGGVYEVTPQSTPNTQCLDVYQASTANGGKIDQWSCNGHTSQRWKLVQPVSNSGQFELVAVSSNKCIDVPGGSTVRGTALQQATCGAKTNQLFTFTAVGSGGGGSGGSGGGSGGSGGGGTGCDKAGLVWKTGSKTNFTSYPAPGSDECIKYSGCLYEGQFAACDNTMSKSWVMSHNIVSFFPNFGQYELHDLCIKSGSKQMVVTVYDTCGDSDCSGCCTQNKGSADALIDIESYTNARFGVEDGRIQWADLGPTKGSGCQ